MRIAESLSSLLFLFSGVQVSVFFSSLSTGGQENIQLIYIKAPGISPNAAVKSDFYTFFVLCQVTM